jgi:hypothetical protein
MRPLNKTSGLFKLIIVGWVVTAIVGISMLCGAVYVLGHFITKAW